MEPILRIPESVKEDTLGYRNKVKRFLDGQTSPVAFRAYRVPMGVYEQRTAGKFMVRIRIGAGLVLPYQLERIAQLSNTYGNGIVHVTTRQDIQIHKVSIEDTPDVIESLLEVGLSPRGGGGNTVRNVTACPRAGVCPKEEFDVAPYAIATAEYLLQDRSSFNLPRKYKIVFSGCSDDCAFASVADLGFFAHINKGKKGFRVYAGGGLGPNARVGTKIEDFITGDEIFDVAAAVKWLFDKHGDRTNKRKARLRYVLGRMGAEEFVRMYKGQREALGEQEPEEMVPEIRDLALGFKKSCPEGKPSDGPSELSPNVIPEKTAGLYTIRLKLHLGDIPADDLVKVGQIADKFGQGLVRTTQLQNMLITGVARDNTEKIIESLKDLSIDVISNCRPTIVACTGAATCKLGLCFSRGLTEAICEQFDKNQISTNGSSEVIRISGCPNSCGNHYIADIGFQGKAKRVNGKLMPCYDVFTGGKTIEGDAHLAETIGTVPAKRIPDLLVEAFSNGAVDKELLKSLVVKSRRAGISVESFPDDYYYDFGSDEPFSLAGRGPGECGAGVMDVIKLDIDEAKDALKLAPIDSENIYKAIVAAARALLVTLGLEPKKDREIFAAFTEHLIEPGWVKPQTRQLLDDAIDWRMGDRESIEDLLPQAEDLTKRVEELYLSLDASLQFKIKPIVQKANADNTEADNHLIDLRGVVCPLNFVKAKLELEKIAVGEILEILLDKGEPARNAPVSLVEQGQEVMEVKNVGDHYCVKVRRKK